MDKHDIRRHVLWETEVTDASWNDDTATWTVRTRDRSGTTTELSARAVITAVGQLDRAHTPTIEGQQDFAGPTFHSSAWDHSVDLRGKRVAMIGAGASGFQIAPTIAPDVEQLTVFQRTAQWMFPNPSYHDEVGPGVQWALKHLPFYGRWYRFLLFWPWCDKGLDVARVDPDYPDQQKAINEISEVTRIMFTDWILSQVGDDPDLQAKVVPDYPATGKRTLQDNGSWLRTLTRDNVELVRTGIDRIEADAVVADDGTRYPADVIVYATGFEHTKLLWPMTIRGRDGEILSERWGERPSAYLGITIPDYPNFFCMNGPGTWLASGGSLIFHSECQMRYITQCLELLIAGGHTTMEPTVRENEGLARTQPGRDAHDGVVTAHDQALVFQEQLRRGAHAEPVAPRRLLDLDAHSRSRRLRLLLTPPDFPRIRSAPSPCSWRRFAHRRRSSRVRGCAGCTAESSA